MFRLATKVLRPFCQQSKKPPYIHPYNVNVEQERDWLKKTEKEKAVQSAPASELLPRRKRHIYDREKFDTDISGFAAWRVYGDDRMFKLSQYDFPVVLKLMIAPKWLKHCFGEGYYPDYNINIASRQYFFEDCNLSQYLLYDFRHTTVYKTNTPGYDYKNQENVEPRRRKVFRYTPDEFWELESEFEFRVNATKYAEHHKFKAWITKMVNDSKGMESYDKFIDSQFGTTFSFNKPEDVKRYQTYEPLVSYVDQSHYSAVEEKEKTADKQQEKKPKKEKKTGKKGEKGEKGGKDEKVAAIQGEKVDLMRQAMDLPDTYVQVKQSSFTFATKLPQQVRANEKDMVSAFAAVFDEQQSSADEKKSADAKAKGKLKKEK